VADWTFVGQLAANGIIVGGGYGLAAVGLTLIFGVLERVNFAHGEFYMLAAYILYFALTALGLSYEAGIVVVLPVMAAIGYVVARAAILPNMDRPFEITVVSTLAVAIIMQSIVRLTAGSTPLDIDTRFEFFTFEIFGILIFGQRALVLSVAAVSFLALHLFLRYSRIGASMRAAAQNREACLMVGIDVRRIAVWSVVWGAVLAGVAGVVMGPLFDLNPDMGVEVVFKSFAVVIMGGMGNVPGAIVSGLVLGVAEAFAAGYVSAAAGEALFFVTMILVLVLRPHGIFGRTVRV
jgi:branched-chain amino acid transport system permease protein